MSKYVLRAIWKTFLKQTSWLRSAFIVSNSLKKRLKHDESVVEDFWMNENYFESRCSTLASIMLNRNSEENLQSRWKSYNIFKLLIYWRQIFQASKIIASSKFTFVSFCFIYSSSTANRTCSSAIRKSRNKVITTSDSSLKRADEKTKNYIRIMIKTTEVIKSRNRINDSRNDFRSLKLYSAI